MHIEDLAAVTHGDRFGFAFDDYDCLVAYERRHGDEYKEVARYSPHELKEFLLDGLLDLNGRMIGQDE